MSDTTSSSDSEVVQGDLTINYSLIATYERQAATYEPQARFDEDDNESDLPWDETSESGTEAEVVWTIH